MSAFPRTDTSLLGRWWWTVDRWVLGSMLLIIGLGIVLTMAASPAVAERLGLDAFHFARRQFAYLPVALLAMLGASLLSPRGVQRVGAGVFAIFMLLTLATLVVGTEIKGATRWIHVGPLSLQPSEFLKPAFAIVCAMMISAARLKTGFPGYTASTLLMFFVAAVLLKQPDVGMTLMFVATWGTQLFLIGLPLFIVGFAIVAFVGAGIGAYLFFSHVRARVDHFLDPSSGSSDGYQVDRALEAFRTGGLFGRGPGEGRVKEVLPDAHSDFILAVAGEEFGLFLCVIIVLLFAFIVLRGLSRALKDDNLFIMLASAGLLTQFGMQALINMASTMHLIPPKGITLPFISYGGSATVALALASGMVLALTRERPGAWHA